MNELAIVRFFNQLGQGTFLDTITVVISFIPFLVIFWLILGMLAVRFDKKKGWLVFLSVAIGILIYFIINDLVFKTFIVDLFGTKLRPYLAYSNEINALGKRFADSSFPSGHMASSVTVFGIFAYYYRKYWLPVLVFILFMAFARMHMGMHYPSDILGGALLGLIYGALGILIARKVMKKKK